MSDIVGRGTGHHPRTAIAVVKESYSFACMRCGHGWEQSYEIEHHLDADNHEFVTYVADGEVVPSPLSHPSCRNCGSNVVRIMRPGRVSSAQRVLRHQSRETTRDEERERAEERKRLEERQRREAEEQRRSGSTAVPPTPVSGDSSSDSGHHHWRPADLLRPFHHRAG